MSDFLVIPLLLCPFLLWPYTQHPRQTRPSSLKGTIFTFHPCTPQSLGQPALLRSPPSTPGSFAPSTPGRQLNGHLSDALRDQIPYLYGKPCKSLFLSTAYSRSRTRWNSESRCNSSKSTRRTQEPSFLQNLRNLVKFRLTGSQPSSQTHPFL